MDPAEKPQRKSASDLTETPRPRLHRGRSTRRRRAWRFQTGKVLGTSLSVWWSRLIPFSVLTIIVFSPYIAMLAWGNLVDQQVLLTLWWQPIDVLLSQVLTYVVSATMIYGVFQRLRGRPVSVATAVSAGLSRLPSVLLVALMLFLCMVLCFLPAFPAALTGSTEFMGLTFFACLALMMFVQCAFFVALAACVVERPGVFGSLQRSLELTKGFRLQIFVIVIAMSLFGAVLGAILGGLVGAALGQEWIWVAGLVGFLIAVSLQAVVSAVTYHELRIAVDGMDAEQLAAIFD